MPRPHEEGGKTMLASNKAKMDRVAREVKQIQLVLRAKGIPVPKAPSEPSKVTKPSSHSVDMHGRNADGTKREEGPVHPTAPKIADNLPAQLQHQLNPSEMVPLDSYPTSISESQEEPLFFKPSARVVPVLYSILEARRARELNDKVHREAVEDYICRVPGTTSQAQPMAPPIQLYRRHEQPDFPPGPMLSRRIPKLPSTMQLNESCNPTPRVVLRPVGTTRESEEEHTECTRPLVPFDSPPCSPSPIQRLTSLASSDHCGVVGESRAGQIGESGPCMVSLPSVKNSCYWDGPVDDEDSKHEEEEASTQATGQFTRQIIYALRSRPHYRDNGTGLSHIFPLSPPSTKKLASGSPLRTSWKGNKHR